jgi:ABC-type transport system involved in multi-copper enzyme maturation permease subunit
LNGLNETAVIWNAEWRRTVRSGRVVVLLGLYSMFSALVLLVVGGITRALREQVESRLSQVGADSDASAQVFAEARKGILGMMVGNDQVMLEALSQVPLVVLIVFKATLLFLPAYVALMGFDQVSGEVGPRSMRYLTVRSRRSSVLLGKFLAQATVLLGLMLIIDLAIFLYAYATTPEFTLGAMVLLLLKFWLAAVVFSLAYLALTTLCSSLFRSPAVSLVFNFILLFAFWLVDVVGTVAQGRNVVEYVRYLSPSHYANNLLHPQFTQFGVSGLAYAVFAALFLGGALFILRARDL